MRSQTSNRFTLFAPVAAKGYVHIFWYMKVVHLVLLFYPSNVLKIFRTTLYLYIRKTHFCCFDNSILFSIASPVFVSIKQHSCSHNLDKFHASIFSCFIHFIYPLPKCNMCTSTNFIIFCYVISQHRPRTKWNNNLQCISPLNLILLHILLLLLQRLKSNIRPRIDERTAWIPDNEWHSGCR